MTLDCFRNFGTYSCPRLQNLSFVHSVSTGLHHAEPLVQPATKLGDAIWAGVSPQSHDRYGAILTAGGDLAHSILANHPKTAVLLI